MRFAELFSYDNELRAEGEATGFEKGKQEEKIKNVINLLDLLDDETISERIGLPLEEVQKIRRLQR